MLRALRRFLGQDDRPTPSGEPPLTWHDRAHDAYGALRHHFAIRGSDLLRERAAQRLYDRQYATLWPFGQAWEAALSLAALGGDDRPLDDAERLRQVFFAHYWDRAIDPPGAPSYPVSAGSGDVFYDDNAWIGLALALQARLTGDRAVLDDAIRVFEFVASGWDDDESHPHPGGVFWKIEPNRHARDRNTCSNGPGAVLGCRLAELTGERHYLDTARRMFDWVNAALRDPHDGLYWDNIKLDGAIDRTKWSYNQGTMIGAAALLARAGGDERDLDRAEATARAAVDHYGEDDRLWRQDPVFNAIFFDNLHLLGEIRGRHDFYLPLLDRYAERAWADGRDPRTGLFHFGRAERAHLITQSAAVRIFATLAAIDAR